MHRASGGKLASITIRKLDDAIKEKLKIRAAANSHSMEEEARQILKSVLDQKLAHSVGNENYDISTMSVEERLTELEKKGIWKRAEDQDRRIPPGEPAPGALKQWLADRNRF